MEFKQVRPQTLKATRLTGFSLEAVESGRDWCKTATDFANLLDKLSEGFPRWKFWIRPGLALAATVIRGVRDIKCGG